MGLNSRVLISHELTPTAQEPSQWGIKQHCKKIKCQICQNNFKFPSTYPNMDSVVRIGAPPPPPPQIWNPIQ